MYCVSFKKLFGLVATLLLVVTEIAMADVTCTITVPDNPLTPQGLATPYVLNPPCSMSNPDTAAFVQAVIFETTNNLFYVYNPLVVSAGNPPAVDPIVPQIANYSVVGIWFGFNGDTLELVGQTHQTLTKAKCVDGFGQFAYCNAPAFFQAVQDAIGAGSLQAPRLGTGKDGRPCPTVRDFSVVDQDQSDNIPSGYLLTSNGKVAQATNQNKLRFPGATLEENASDNGLLNEFIMPALGCSPWTAQDLADPTARYVPALPLNEIQASEWQSNQAIVPANDPMVLTNGQYNRTKLNLYRAGVFQPSLSSSSSLQQNAATYCTQFRESAQRIYDDRTYTQSFASPDTGAATNLYTFLAQRFVASYSNLNCQSLINKSCPFSFTVNHSGQANSASFSM